MDSSFVSSEKMLLLRAPDSESLPMELGRPSFSRCRLSETRSHAPCRSYPDYGRFWEIVEKHKVSQFYTAPTAIRALAKQDLSFVTSYDISSLKVIGTVGEPINEEAWQWYHKHIGQNRCPIVDTWWQTETGGILISPIPNCYEGKPTYATLPFVGVQPVLMDENGHEILESKAEGRLCIKYPWPSIARTIWGNHKRYKDTYFSAYKNY